MKRFRGFWSRGLALVTVSVVTLQTAAAAQPTFTVNSPADVVDANPGDGKCETSSANGGNGICTLRAAIMEANQTDGGATINFGLPGSVTYLLGIAPSPSPSPADVEKSGSLKIHNPIAIVGNGPANTIIDGNQTDRVFFIQNSPTPSPAPSPSPSPTKVSISGVTIQHGKNSNVAGGIYNVADLTLTNVTVANNTVDGLNDWGAGIYNAGPLTVDRCTFANNATGTHNAYGGAMYTQSATTITDSTITGNMTSGSIGQGGGIFGVSPALTIKNSTINGNSATRGGGIYAGLLTLINSTVTGNSAAGAGGGIYHSANTMGLYNVTIAGNTANTGGTGQIGGGVASAAGTVSFQNTIIGNNIRVELVNGHPVAEQSDCSGTLTSAGYNIISENTDCHPSGSGVTVTSPDLDALADNGGPTQTRALLTGSPAIDAGNPGGCTDNLGAMLTSDQRGYARPYPPGNPCDIGAFELQPTPTPTPSPTATPTPTPTPTPTATASPTPPSQLQNLSTRKQVGAGDNVLIGGFIVVGTEDKKILLRGLGPTLPVTGALADPTLELHTADTTLLAMDDNWKDTQEPEIDATGIPPGNDLESAVIATVAAKPASANGAGYTGVLAGKGGSSGIGLLEIYDLNIAANSKLANISTRGFVGTGDDLLIGGFIPGPSDRLPIRVLVRALGPSLTAQGVSGALQDPLLELHDENGTLLMNDNWQDASNASEIQATLPPPDDRESAIITTLAPSATGYTAVVRGANGNTGVALVEVYSLD